MDTYIIFCILSVYCMEPFDITIKGYGIEEKIPVKSGNSSRVYLPASWAGKKVRVVLVEPLED